MALHILAAEGLPFCYLSLTGPSSTSCPATARSSATYVGSFPPDPPIRSAATSGAVPTGAYRVPWMPFALGRNVRVRKSPTLNSRILPGPHDDPRTERASDVRAASLMERLTRSAGYGVPRGLCLDFP